MDVELPGGRTVEVRAIQPSDAPALAGLYESLDDDDRHRRFFSSYRPSPRLLERMTTVEQRGGYALIALPLETDTDGESPRIIGHADYSLLPDGDGEMSITVADGWRGWLGTFLLDRLAIEAAARGVPNFEADILVTNAPMMALARRRGSVTMSRPDWAVVRVLMPTADPMPSWPDGHERPRVLVEGAGGRWRGEERARDKDLEVLICPGPVANKRGCPALAGRPCPLALGADVIVMLGSHDEPQWAELRRAHRVLHGPAAVCADHPRDEGVDAVAELARARLAARALGDMAGQVG